MFLMKPRELIMIVKDSYRNERRWEEKDTKRRRRNEEELDNLITLDEVVLLYFCMRTGEDSGGVVWMGCDQWAVGLGVSNGEQVRIG